MDYLIKMINELAPVPVSGIEQIRVLDIGCGNGGVVQQLRASGLDAKGCDLKFKEGDNKDALYQSGHIHIIENEPYRLPYPDASFDVIVSNQVMEHVQDYKTTLSEIRRVLRDDGVSIHIFPSRLKPLESHIFVPMASVFQSYWYLLFWSCLGIRKPNQKGLSCFEVAAKNAYYLKTSTNYRSGREIFSAFQGAGFREVYNGEYVFLKYSPNSRGRTLYRLGRYLPVLFWLYRTFWSRVIVTRR